ncbi:MAG: autotransporter-associated beta strand repeat-containing protein [Chthoniobacterales bacterium]
MKSLTVACFSSTLQLLRIGKLLGLLGCCLLLLGQGAYGADGTWVANPVDNNWNNPANWSSGTVPGVFDTAFFAGSNTTNINITQGTALENIMFNSGAGAFTITALPSVGVGFGLGIENDSSVEQNFVAATDDSNSGGFSFNQEVDNVTITGPVTFTQQAQNTATGNAGFVNFFFAGAGDATFHDLGASVAGGFGGRTDFYYTGASAENCAIINDGGTAAGAIGGGTSFSQQKPSVGNATLIANSGTNGGGGGFFDLVDGSLGGTARLEVFGNGYMDMSAHTGPSLSIGSIEGDGQIYLGKSPLMVGTNKLSTIFSGVLHPGDPSGGSGTGALIKTGSGTLTLTGANLYTAGTTVSAGTLVVSNKTGSGTGTGAVSVNAGTLGGSGIISGVLTIGVGAFLAPAHGTKAQATLTIQSSLTFNADSTYTYTFKAKKKKAKTDKVIANGVMINGATVVLQGTTQGSLTRGAIYTLISNTATTPIAGAFSNLPDGAIVSVNGNNLQASYEGGDGNDLTLTVVP